MHRLDDRRLQLPDSIVLHRPRRLLENRLDRRAVLRYQAEGLRRVVVAVKIGAARRLTITNLLEALPYAELESTFVVRQRG
ncbi:MAG: hypothetical protein AAF663_12850, partial [Planctomycetota bacterium]